MQVFKTSLAILKRNIPSILIYVGIFLALSLLFSSGARDQEEEFTEFDLVKTNIAVFTEEDTPLVQGFLKNLQESTTFIEVQDDKNFISDALYFRIVTYVIRIPEGFTKAFLENRQIALETQSIPGSAGNIYTDLSINTFFNTANLFLSVDEKISQESLVQKTTQALSQKTPIEMESSQLKDSDSYAKFFFNYMSYSLVSILILGTSLVMLVWKDQDLARRTEVSPLSRISVLLQKYLALGIFALFTWVLLFSTYFIFSGQSTENNFPLYLANSFVFTFTSLTLSVLVGTFLKSRNAISAVSNVIALGPSFISGAFVPQELLGQSVLNIAKFTPTYWYVTSNNAIASLSSATTYSLSPIFRNMLIVALFGFGFLILSSLAGKRKTKAA